MNTKNEGFTLVELTISIFIFSTIIIWILNNFENNNLKVNIYDQIKEFNFDTHILNNYSSWITYSWWILLYNNNFWILIWSFLDTELWRNYNFFYDRDYYKKYYFWYFILNTNTLSWILNNSLDIRNLKFNNWKIYDKLVIKDIEIKTYNTWSIFELNVNFFKKYTQDYNWNKNNILIKKDDYLNFNFYF